MSRKAYNVGLIGYQFMGKAHSNAYRQVGRFFDLPADERREREDGTTPGVVELQGHAQRLRSQD